jgi:hypothetical protein
MGNIMRMRVRWSMLTAHVELPVSTLTIFISETSSRAELAFEYHEAEQECSCGEYSQDCVERNVRPDRESGDAELLQLSTQITGVYR